MEDKVPSHALCMEGTNWGMMGYLLRYQPETLLLSVGGRKERINEMWMCAHACVHLCVPDELIGLSQQRIERFSSSVPLRRNCWHSKGSYCLKKNNYKSGYSDKKQSICVLFYFEILGLINDFECERSSSLELKTPPPDYLSFLFSHT